MSDEGEKTCPLCAEDMDLTDQQLKPCKCGYEICVWCWHHIMDMAEKDDTEGRCPACRTPYDKEKIVGMAAKCERLVAEINSERKMKAQKSKTKTSEGRKQLSSVRVIQRNLVYIVGLPLNLADEELLQHKEYFGQYGKVLKVSMSRTAAGVIQQFPNNTCSVYITYAKEEEAIRCIQSVHGFVLEGRSLKACFGTTKYCHAWLRNVPCSNPDCLYLHEIGSQEDSFTKDEIISAYTRVQQITGATNNMQRRSGNVLPPPVDDYCHSNPTSIAKPIARSAPNSTAASVSKGSPPNGVSGRSIGLPAGASWGMRATNQPSPVTSLPGSNGPLKQKSDTVSSTLACSSALTNKAQASVLHCDGIKKPSEETLAMHMKSKLEILKPVNQNVGSDCRTALLEKPAAPDGSSADKPLLSSPSISKYNDHIISGQSSVTSSLSDRTGQSCVSSPEKGGSFANEGSLCSDIASLNIDRSSFSEYSGMTKTLLSDHGLVKSPASQRLQEQYTEHYQEPLSSPALGRSMTLPNGVCIAREQSDWRTDLSPLQALVNTSSELEDVLSFDCQRLKDPEVVSHATCLPNSSSSLHLLNHSRSHSFQQSEGFGSGNASVDTLVVDNKVSESSQHRGSSTSLSNGYPERFLSSNIGSDITAEGSFLLQNEGKGKMGRSCANIDSDASKDTGESSIISNILSLDLDTWDESLASPQNLAKLLGDTDKQATSLKGSSLWRGQNTNQSRFSFARQEDPRNQPFDVEPAFGISGQLSKNHSFNQGFVESRDPFFDKIGICNGVSSGNFEESDNFASSPSVFSLNKLSVSRAQISAPPGFSVHSRAPPPGFSPHERVEQSFDNTSGNHYLDSSSLLRNSYQAPQNGNIGSAGDIEFMDPAILAVGKGRLQGGLNNSGLDIRSNFPPQLSAFENDARLHLLMQRSLSPHQNLRFAEVGDGFSSFSDSYGISSRLMDQSQVSNMSPFAQLSLQQSRNSHLTNGHWDGWNEVQGGNSLGMAELLRNERLGFNKYYNGYEDAKFRMPSSGDLYNRTFGM